MNLPQVYMCSPSWTLLPPPSPYHPSGSFQCTSPKHLVSCIEPGLATHSIYDIIRISMPFSQIIPPSPSPTVSKRLFYTSVSLLLSRTQGYILWISDISFYDFIPSILGLLCSLDLLCWIFCWVYKADGQYWWKFHVCWKWEYSLSLLLKA